MSTDPTTPPNPGIPAAAVPAPASVDLAAMISSAIAAHAPKPATPDLSAVIAETVRATLASASPARSVPPATGYAPAPVTVVSDAPDNVLNWGQDQVNAYIGKHYPVPGMPWHAKNAAARRTLSQKVNAAMARTRIITDPRGGGDR